MINPGLVWLLRRSPLTLVRGLRRRFRGPKGILLAIWWRTGRWKLREVD